MLVLGELSVPHPQEKTPEPTTELPNPELNPLLNPTLGRNLGRWAEVYFTSPPEKREEAVVELLRELKAGPVPEPTESGGDTRAIDARRTNPPARFETSEIITSGPVRCAECGHRYHDPQRFCGMCGAPMAYELPPPEDYRPERAIAARVPEPVFQQTPLFSMIAPAPITQSSFDDGSEIAWLREKKLAAESQGGTARKYTAALLAMVAIGVLIYAQFRPQGSQARPAASTTVAPRSERTAPPAPVQAAVPAPTPPTPEPVPTTAPGNAASAASNSTAAPPGPRQTIPEENQVPRALPAASAPRPQAVNAPPPQLEANPPSTANGSEELALALDYLNGKRGPRDSAEATKFLWKAVGKENPSAILLLSDMYLIGDGVPRSCDQARLLLNAATRKNVPQAAQKLRNLQTSGCR
jgi:hypothetical protein